MRDARHHAFQDAPVARPACGSSSGPKRSESITAMGRAPMVKISRKMPPTPVAAP